MVRIHSPRPLSLTKTAKLSLPGHSVPTEEPAVQIPSSPGFSTLKGSTFALPQLPSDSVVDSSRLIATLYATREGAVDRAQNRRDQDQPNEDDRYTLMRYAHFRVAAEDVAAAFGAIPNVSRVALFGSIASSPRTESARVRARRGHVHEPKDVDLAVWLDGPTELERIRLVRSRAVNQLWKEREVGVAHPTIRSTRSCSTLPVYISVDSAASINARSTNLSAAQPTAARCRFCDSATNSFCMRTHFGPNESASSTIAPQAGSVVP